MSWGDNMTIGERIKNERKKAGLTQQELADRLGVSFANISQYENNKRNPKHETVFKIADAIGVNPYYLLYGVDREQMEQIGLALIKYDSVLKKEFNNAEEREKSLMRSFRKLNPDGQQVAVERVEELTEIKKYRKDGEDPHDPGIE